jgi:polysaccharide biosynthesis PFTS motif protein
MSSKYKTISPDQLFDRLTSKIGSYLSDNLYSLGYSSNAVSDRFLRNFTHLEGGNFSRQSLQYESERTILDNNVIKLQQFQCNVQNGNIVISSSYFIKSIFKFVIIWFRVLFLSLRSLLLPSNKDGKKFTLLYGVDNVFFSDDRQDLDFVKFCKSSPVTPLNQSTHLIVENVKKMSSYKPEYITYSKNPLYCLLHKKSMTISEFNDFFILHCIAAFEYLKLVFRHPVMVILYNDFSHHSLANYLNQNSIKDVLITISSTASYPLWMVGLSNKRFLSHMLWYSESYFGFRYVEVEQYPRMYKYIRVDKHWVWTKGFASFLQKMKVPGFYHSVGPILFYPRPSDVELKALCKENSINISVFDVSPENNKWATINGCARPYVSHGVLKYERIDYYTPEVVSQFVKDIISSSEKMEIILGVKVKLYIKPKRVDIRFEDRIHEKNDINYINYIKNCPSINILPPSYNMYEMIAKTNFSIVIPFSSPAFVASDIGIPAIYFDPTNEICYKTNDNKISFASGKKELLNKMISLVEKNR